MKLIPIGIDEDILDYVKAIVAEEDLHTVGNVEDVEVAFVNLLLRKALGVGSGTGVDPLIDDVVDTMLDTTKG